MQNAAFAARGLDWRYDGVRRRGRRRGRARARRARLRRRQRDDPVQAGGRRRPATRADGDAVNTLVFRDGRVLGFNTDREILAGIAATRACVIGGGGAARALAPRCPRTTRMLHALRRLAARRDRLRPDRQRDAGSRRAAGRRPTRARPSSTSPTGRPRRRSSRRRAPPAARSSTAARRSCVRERRASGSGRGSSRRST